VHEPRGTRVLFLEELDDVIRCEGREPVLGWPIAFGVEKTKMTTRHVVTETGEMIHPWLVRSTQIEFPIHSGEQTFVCKEAGIIGSAGDPRIDRLVGVAEENRSSTGAAGE
jgi:hypothetical protein